MLHRSPNVIQVLIPECGNRVVVPGFCIPESGTRILVPDSGPRIWYDNSGTRFWYDRTRICPPWGDSVSNMGERMVPMAKVKLSNMGPVSNMWGCDIFMLSEVFQVGIYYYYLAMKGPIGMLLCSRGL